MKPFSKVLVHWVLWIFVFFVVAVLLHVYNGMPARAAMDYANPNGVFSRETVPAILIIAAIVTFLTLVFFKRNSETEVEWGDYNDDGYR